MTHEIPLGRAANYPKKYAPEILFPIARAEARRSLDISDSLPFTGRDIWNAWELTWLDTRGKPIVAIAVITVDATSLNIIESKSLKLYLNSFAMTRFDSADAVGATITSDLSLTAADPVTVSIATASQATRAPIDEFRGVCIDDQLGSNWMDRVDPSLLRSDRNDQATETLHSHCLRSLCPVTAQPDIGSLAITYTGPKIDRASLLEYIVSYRQHNGFHEDCVERMFLDIRQHCATENLSVYARYNRRGGLDINPFRTDTGELPTNCRLWRQ